MKFFLLNKEWMDKEKSKVYFFLLISIAIHFVFIFFLKMPALPVFRFDRYHPSQIYWLDSKNNQLVIESKQPFIFENVSDSNKTTKLDAKSSLKELKARLVLPSQPQTTELVENPDSINEKLLSDQSLAYMDISIPVNPLFKDVATPPSSLSGNNIQITGAFKDRELTQQKVPEIPQSKNLLKSTVCRLGVNKDGLVEIVLLEESSGDLNVDRVALQSLKKWRFKTEKRPGLQWGKVEIFWDMKETE